MLDAFIAVVAQRERVHTQQTQPEEEQEESLDPSVPALSIHAIVNAHGLDYIRAAIWLT
jgi:hypothetical protein